MSISTDANVETVIQYNDFRGYLHQNMRINYYYSFVKGYREDLRGDQRTTECKGVKMQWRLGKLLIPLPGGLSRPQRRGARGGFIKVIK